MSKSNILKDFERYIKKNIKGKLKFSKALVVSFLISGGFSATSYSYDYKKLQIHSESIGDPSKGTGVNYEHSTDTKDSVILANEHNKAGEKTKLKNKDFEQTVVIGSQAVGGGKSATAIGYKAIVGKNLATTTKEEEHQGTAVGYRAFSYGKESISLGNDTVAYGESSISIGSDNIGKGSGENGVNPYAEKALSYDIWELFYKNGAKFNYTNEYSTVNGHGKEQSEYKKLYDEYLKLDNDLTKPNWKTHNWAYGDSSIAIGSRNVAYGHSSVALGTASIAKGNYSTALGTGTLAFGTSSVALGNEVYIYSDQSVGVGNNVQALKKGAMVYGLNSYTGGEGSVAIGERALSNVQIKGEHTNIVNDAPELVQLEKLYDGAPNDNQNKTFEKLGKLDQNKEKLYEIVSEKQDGTGENKAKDNSKNGGVAIGYYVIASGENSLALGRQAYSKGERSVAIGPYSYAKGDNSFALGYGSKAIEKDTFAIGSYSRADGKNSIALGVEAKVLNNSSDNNLNGENSLALGNESEVKMRNSVALGYKSTTNYFYNVDKNTPMLSGTSAIGLEAYYPKGSTYSGAKINEASGVISVGGWNESGKVGLRRIVNVAPGALDSDVATVGQLKTLAYVKKEGVVTYYTQLDNGNIQKLVKSEDDNKFYVVDTKNGEPLDKSNPIAEEKVFAGPKGANEQVVQMNGKTTADMGEKIRFGHLKDAQISSKSDQAVTGAQLDSVKEVLGVDLESSNTKFEKPSFIAVEYVDSKKETKNTFKDALNETITAINKGYTFSDGTDKGTHYLGDILTIKAGNIDKQSTDKLGYSSDNIKTKYNANNKEILIGIKDDPTFEKVTLSKAQEYKKENKVDEKELITKGYLDGALKDVASSFTVTGDVANSGTGTRFKIGDTLNINGDSSNIQTKVDTNTKKVIVTLKDSLTDISSITSKNVPGNSNSNLKTEIKFNQSNSGVGNTNLTIISNGAKYAFGPQGFNLNNKPIKGLKGALEGNSDTNLGYILSNTSNENNGYGNIKNQAVNVEDLAKVASKIIDKGLSFEGDSGTVTRKLGESLKIVGEKATDTLNSGSSTTTIATAPGNISVKNKSNSTDTLEIGLAKELKGISSIENEKDKSKIELKDESIVLTSVKGKSLTFDKEGKLTGLSEGTISDNSTDAVTGKQLNEIKNQITNTEIKYKANSSGEQTVALSSGLNFTSTDNITTSVEANGVVKHTLNKKLTGIEEINKANNKGALKLADATASLESAKDNSNVKLAANKATLSAGNDKANVEVNTTGATISAGKDKASISAKDNQISLSSGKNGKTLTYDNDGKLSGLEDGKIAANSKEAITGNQLNDLGSKLGLEVETNKTEFKSPTFIKLKDATTGNDTTADAPTTLKAAIDKNIETLNKGFKLAGDKNKAGATQYLGSTININAGDITDNSTSYKGKNLKTEYSYENGNGTIKIGLTENPEFKSVEFNNGENATKIAKISTDENGNIVIETQKADNKTDGTKVTVKRNAIDGVKTVGTDDTNNISFEKSSAGAGGAQTPAKAKITVDGSAVEFKKSTTTDETDKILISNVASPVDNYDAANKKYVDDQLKAGSDVIKNSVIKFAGETADKTVDKKLGDTLTIKGKNKKDATALTDDKLSDGNIAVIVDETDPKNKFLKIGLAKDLKDLSSVEFLGENKYGKDREVKVITKLNSDGLELKEFDQGSNDPLKITKYSIGKALFKAEKDNQFYKKETQIDHQGTLVRDIEKKLEAKYYADGTIINELDDDKYGEVKENGKSAKYKLDGITLENKDPKNQSKTTITDSSVTIDTNKEKVILDKDGITFTKEDNSEGIKINAKDSEISGVKKIGTDKNNISFDNSVGPDKVTLTIDENSLDFKKSTTENEKDKVVISNVATPQADYDAANKKYVDDKISGNANEIKELNDNIPVVYTDKDGKVLVKKDGKFYTPNADGTASENLYTGDVYVSVKKVEKQKSGLGLTNETPLEDLKEKVNKLLGNEINDSILNNVATVMDIQALGQTGMEIEGNNASYHRNLGQTLTIKGDQTANLITDTINQPEDKDKKLFNSAQDNINVKVDTDKLIVQLADELTNLKKAVFEKEVLDKDGNRVKVTNTVDADGSTLKGKDGITAEYKIDGAKVADKDGNTTEVKADGTTVKAKDGKTAEYKAGSAKLTDGDKSTETTADGITIKKGDKDTDKVLEIKNNNGNGEINFAKEDKVVEGKKEKVGTGKITGLADLDENSDATSAVNKNYVDSRIKDLADSSPIKYVDEEGTKLVKGKDGKIYRPNDIEGKKYVNGKGYVTNPTDEKEKAVADVKDAKAVLEPETKLSGVNSGLGLDKKVVKPEITDNMSAEDKAKAEQEAKEVTAKAKKEAADNFINNPLNEKDVKNAVNVEDLHKVSKSIIDKGISFGADKGEATKKALGETLKVNGGKNINTEIKGGNIEVNLDDKIILEEVKTGDSTLNTNGLKVSGPTKKALTEDEAKAKGLTEADRVKAEDDGFEQDDDGKYFYYLPETGAKYEKDGTSIKGENGKSAEYKLDGATIRNEQGSAVLSPTSLTFNDNDGNSKVKIDGATASMSVGKVNVDGEKATITGLADLNENSHGSSATNKNYVDSKLGNLEEKVTGEIGSASALNAALAALKPLSYDPLRKSQFSAGMGMYKGQTAFALGLNHYTSENTLINGGVSFASGSNINNRRDIMFNLGFTHKFGSKADIDRLPAKYQAGPISSVYVMQDEIQLLQKTNQKQAEIIKAQEAKAAAQDERITKLEEQIKELLKNK